MNVSPSRVPREAWARLVASSLWRRGRQQDEAQVFPEGVAGATVTWKHCAQVAPFVQARILIVYFAVQD